MGVKCRVRMKLGNILEMKCKECIHICKHIQELMFILHYCVNISVSRKEDGGVLERSRPRRCAQEEMSRIKLSLD